MRLSPWLASHRRVEPLLYIHSTPEVTGGREQDRVVNKLAAHPFSTLRAEYQGLSLDPGKEEADALWQRVSWPFSYTTDGDINWHSPLRRLCWRYSAMLQMIPIY